MGEIARNIGKDKSRGVGIWLDMELGKDRKESMITRFEVCTAADTSILYFVFSFLLGHSYNVRALRVDITTDDGHQKA